MAGPYHGGCKPRGARRARNGKRLGRPAGSLAEYGRRVMWGRCLSRRLSLDEQYQIINVVRGQMSFVDSRSRLPWLVEECDPWERLRLPHFVSKSDFSQERIRCPDLRRGLPMWRRWNRRSGMSRFSIHSRKECAFVGRPHERPFRLLNDSTGAGAVERRCILSPGGFFYRVGYHARL